MRFVRTRMPSIQLRTSVCSIVLFILFTLTAAGCTVLGKAPAQPPVTALPPASSGLFSEVNRSLAARHVPGQSAFLPLIDNREAMNWRLALVDHAAVSIDAQYFIWQRDEAGYLLLDRLIQAADRGVRVRLLVDNMMLTAKSKNLAAISRHPNFEIRIYNPGAIRESRLGALGEFIIYFKELNRRMHNKLFVVDGQMAIVGGRNIGNPYFGLSEKYNFRDFDVLVAGMVVGELGDAFDKYWNADTAYPGAAMADLDDAGKIREQLYQQAKSYLKEHAEVLSAYPLQRKDWTPRFLRLPGQMVIGEAHFIQDEPVDIGGEKYRLLDMLGHIADPAREELIIVTPYLIPAEGFWERLSKLRSRDVAVRIITGSMGANNHTAAHSHYKKYRRQFLEEGVELYEFRHDPSAAMKAVSDVSPVSSEYICLHVKAIVSDRKVCFVGSLNLDPRAVEINTESGLYIRSPALSEILAKEFEQMMAPQNAWRVYLNEDGDIRWRSSEGIVSRQPARSMWQRISDFFFRLLPIEGQI